MVSRLYLLLLLPVFGSAIVVHYSNGTDRVFSHRTAAFSPDPAQHPVTSLLKLNFQNDTPLDYYGCQMVELNGTDLVNITNLTRLQFNGSVILMERGVCDFSDKATWAIQIGAAAAIIGNNVTGDQVIAIGASAQYQSSIVVVAVSNDTAGELTRLLYEDPEHVLNITISGEGELPGDNTYFFWSYIIGGVFILLVAAVLIFLAFRSRRQTQTVVMMGEPARPPGTYVANIPPGDN